MNDLIKYIIDNKIKCYFISPHQDDAIFSAGGLISYLSDKTDVVIVNVFDGLGEPPYTLSTKMFVKKCGFKDVNSLSVQRYREDRIIAASLNVSIINFGNSDAIRRKKFVHNPVIKRLGNYIPEILHIYPIYRINVKNGKISKHDIPLMNKLKNQLLDIINGKNVIVFCPAAIGGHVDHKIVRQVCEEMKYITILWSDFPYNRSLKNVISTKSLSQYFVYENKNGQAERYDLIKKYTSQNQVWECKSGARITPEIYYLKQEIRNELDNKTSNEAPTSLRSGYLLPSLRREQNPSEAENSSHSSASLRSRFSAKGDKYDFHIVDKLTKDLEDEWNSLWNKSPISHIFNSPEWFSVCNKTYYYSNIRYIFVYRDEELVLVLPLVEKNIFGLYYYTGFGEKYEDKSGILSLNYDRDLFKNLFEFILSKFNNVLLNEVDTQILGYSIDNKKIISQMSSITPYIPKCDNILHFLNKKHKKFFNRILSENINDYYIKRIDTAKLKYIKLLHQIESGSTRKLSGKGTFYSSDDLSFLRNIFQVFDNMICFVILYYKNKPAAFRLGFKNKGVYYTWITAYKGFARIIFPGKILLYFVLKNNFDNTLKHVDMLRGDSQVKQEFTPFIEQRFNLFISNKFGFRIIFFIKNYISNHIINTAFLYKSYLLFKRTFINIK